MIKELSIFTGRKRAPPNVQDLTVMSPELKELLGKVGVAPSPKGKPSIQTHSRGGAPAPAAVPASVDLTKWCPAPMMQGNFDTCAVHVVAGLVEYFEQRAYGTSTCPSRRFLFRTAKNLAGTATDEKALEGVYIRQAMGALQMLGAPPEKYFPYPDVTKPDAAAQLTVEPTAFCYALAADYKAVTYYRLDPRDASGKLSISEKELLDVARRHIAAGISVTIDFPLYADMIHNSLKSGEIAYPSPADKAIGNHAVMICGYDDARMGGAFRILNSWGTSWGKQGHGWLSYDYLLEGEASDLWTLLKSEWTETGKFGIES
jgi:C1A family cysteine protease